MRNYNVDQHKVQSYFKGLCKNFCILFEEIRRLEKQLEELEKLCPDEELEVVNRLIDMSDLEKWSGKYVTHKYSKEELEQEKEKLQLKMQEYEKELKELEEVKNFWGRRCSVIRKELNSVISEMKEKGFKAIITSKEEIIALMFFYRDNSIEEYYIINTVEKYLISFPTGEKMYEEFYAAYCLKNQEKMTEIYKKYF